jgi:hypothetical protein
VQTTTVAEGSEELRPFVAFHAALLASYQRFVSELAAKVGSRCHRSQAVPSPAELLRTHSGRVIAVLPALLDTDRLQT